MTKTIIKSWRMLVLVAMAAMLGLVFAPSLAAPAEAGHNPPLDVVFIIDESGSMGGEIAAVQANVNFIAANLDPPFHPSFGLVGYGSITAGHGAAQGAHIHTDLPTDAAGLAVAVGQLVANGFTERGVQATIDTLANLNFSGAPSCIILITDEDSDGGNLAVANAALAAQGSVWFGIVPLGVGNTATNYGPSVGSMSETTGGAVFGIAGFAANPQPVLDALLLACELAILQGIDLEPLTDTNDVGQDHTVTATLTDNLGDPVVGSLVTFTVTAGPNANAGGPCSANANCTTDANGQVSFTYTGSGGVGTDTIRACFVDQDGNPQCATVTKDWVDTTRPLAACEASDNPAGNEPKAPGKGGKGQNQDGFYRVSAVDNVDPNPQVFVVDMGTDNIFGTADDTTFGGFLSPTNIKYTEANGATPSIKPGSGEVDWKIKGQGDAAVFAVDSSGNASDPVFCLVPPPPK